LNVFKPVVLALAQALIDHPQRTLNADEIDAVISQRWHVRRWQPSKPAAPYGGEPPKAPPASPRH
jgi:hypothetical protein